MSTSQTVLIVGGTSGLGQAVANLVSARGDTAIVAGRSQERVDQVVSALGQDAREIVMDLTDAASISAAAQTLGHVDHLVLSAASLSYGPFADLDIDDAKAVFENKFWGYYRVVKRSRRTCPRMPASRSCPVWPSTAPHLEPWPSLP
jgi:NAD(P)-dependent dehydrogenase (short-subunit alcohol dehydrogenase family)